MEMTMATRTPQQQQLVQLERNLTMAIAANITAAERRPSTVLWHHQQRWHTLYQEHCKHVLPSKCNWNTTAAGITTTGTRSNNGNAGNCDILLQWNADRESQSQNGPWPWGSSAKDKTMLEARNNTIISDAAVGNSIPRNTVYIFLLHFYCVQ